MKQIKYFLGSLLLFFGTITFGMKREQPEDIVRAYIVNKSKFTIYYQFDDSGFGTFNFLPNGEIKPKGFRFLNILRKYTKGSEYYEENETPYPILEFITKDNLSRNLIAPKYKVQYQPEKNAVGAVFLFIKDSNEEKVGECGFGKIKLNYKVSQ